MARASIICISISIFIQEHIRIEQSGFDFSLDVKIAYERQFSRNKC